MEAGGPLPTGYLPHSLTLTDIPTGFEAEILTGQMPFLAQPTVYVKALKAQT